MRHTHQRQIVVSDRTIRVQGDFGGGYTAAFPPNDPEVRAVAIAQAVRYMPNATLIEAGDPATAELAGLLSALRAVD